MEKPKKFLTRSLDWLVSILPKPIANIIIWINYWLSPKQRDVFDNSEITMRDGKILITRPDGHIVIDEDGNVKIL